MTLPVQWCHIGNVCNFHKVVSWTRPQLSSWVLLLDRDLSVSSKVRVVKIGEKKLVLGNSLVTTLIFVFLKLSVKPLGMRSSFVWVSSFILNWSTLCVLHVYLAIILFSLLSREFFDKFLWKKFQFQTFDFVSWKFSLFLSRLLSAMSTNVSRNLFSADFKTNPVSFSFFL